MRIERPWLGAPGARAVMTMLGEGGHRALYVGGCVRDALMGRDAGDIDVATDALPARVTELATAAGLRAVPTGEAHGTITVVADGQPYEVTTFRRDVETDGRRAVVAFTDRLEEDASRRDFTMNALYAEADGTVVDPLGGLPDLEARRVRFVGEPEARIREDYLRILRFFRFNAWHGRGIDAEGLAACAALADGLESLSGERVGMEMKKLLAAPDPAPALAAMEASGVLARVMPGATPAVVAPLVHLEEAPGGWTRRAAAMGGEVSGWRLSRAEAKALTVLRGALEAGTGLGEVAWRHGPEAAWDVALVRGASAGAIPPGAREEIARGAEAEMPVRAADLADALSGKALGDGLRRAERAWIDSGFDMGREALVAAALASGDAGAPP